MSLPVEIAKIEPDELSISKRNSVKPGDKFIKINMEPIQEVLPHTTKSNAAGLQNKPREFTIFGTSLI